MSFLIEYGSGSDQDGDYLAVFDDLPRSSALTAGGIDLWAISEGQLEKFIALLDPFVSEPILTGRLSYGSEVAFNKYKAMLAEQPVSTDVVRHLLCRSMEIYLVACQRIHTHDDSTISRREFWSGLSFSVSYWCYATYYSNHANGAVPLNVAISACRQRIQSLWDDIQERKKTAGKIEEKVLDKFVSILLKST